MDPAAIIKDILLRLRAGQDMDGILQYACEALTNGLGASRCVVWRVVGDGLEAVTEFSSSGQDCFKGNSLSTQQSMFVTLGFLSRFPEEGTQVISVPDLTEDNSMHQNSPMLTSLLELGDVRSRLVGGLRSRGIFSGFVDLQQTGATRDWSPSDCETFAEVVLLLSVIVQQIYDVLKVCCDAGEFKLMFELTCLFRDTTDRASAWQQAAAMVASFMGFENSQVYLKEEKDGATILGPQLKDQSSDNLTLTETKNPYVATFTSGRGKVVNDKYEKDSPPDPFFAYETALLLPLTVDTQTYGVIGLWKRLPNARHFFPQDREFGLIVAQVLAVYARPDRA